MFQESKNAAYGLAAGGRACVVGGDGGVREGVPGEGRLIARCLFGDGQERRQRGGVVAEQPSAHPA